jgi:hypothetical protein
MQYWLKLCQIKIDENKSSHVTFITRTAICPVLYLNGTHISQAKWSILPNILACSSTGNLPGKSIYAVNAST